MTEKQKYVVTGTLPGSRIEIREYEPCVMADVVVDAEYRHAGNIGFRPLVTYISRNNIAMTVPVIQEQTPEQKWVVSFVMPAGKTLQDLPWPSQSGVTLRSVPRHRAAALKFSGITTEARTQQFQFQLLETLKKNGIIPIGEIRTARFDPPWKLGFLRHNEVVVDIN